MRREAQASCFKLGIRIVTTSRIVRCASSLRAARSAGRASCTTCITAIGCIVRGVPRNSTNTSAAASRSAKARISSTFFDCSAADARRAYARKRSTGIKIAAVIGAQSVFITFEDGAVATAIYNGYGAFMSSEITYDAGEVGYPQDVAPGSTRAAMKAASPEAEGESEAHTRRQVCGDNISAESALLRLDDRELRGRATSVNPPRDSTYTPNVDAKRFRSASIARHANPWSRNSST